MKKTYIKQCLECNKPFPAHRYNHIYCSRQCCNRHYFRNYYLKHKKAIDKKNTLWNRTRQGIRYQRKYRQAHFKPVARLPVKCAVCGIYFTPKVNLKNCRRFCNHTHYQRWHYQYDPDFRKRHLLAVKKYQKKQQEKRKQ